MRLERDPERRELLEQSDPLGRRKRGDDADVSKRVVLVVEREEQRAHRRQTAKRPEAGEDAIGRSLPLDLGHRPLARNVSEVERLGHDPVDAGALEPIEPAPRDRRIGRRRREPEVALARQLVRSVVVDMSGMKKLSDEVAFGLVPEGLNARYSKDPQSPFFLLQIIP